jgi:hypothetical protein
VTTAPARPPRDRRAGREEAPKAPWSPIPLVELCILLGLVLIVLGFVTSGSKRGAIITGGFVLVTLASLELAIREHLAGYRPHSALLAGACAVAVDAVLYFFTPWPQELLLGLGIAIFGIAFWLLRRAFTARSGGRSFRA